MQVIHEPVDTEPEFITQLVAMLRTALQDEMLAYIDVVDTDTHLTKMKAVILTQAYADGTISSINPRTCLDQEIKIVADNDDYQELLARSLDIRETFSFAEIDRKVVEWRVSLIKAWLLSRHEYLPPDILGPISPMLPLTDHPIL